jgi:hypothetical protein
MSIEEQKITGKAGTMTSVEIAEVVGKPHNDVLKSIRRMETAWEKVNGGKFSLVNYTDSKGEQRPMYKLTKSECLYVATKFNDEARAKLILRWEELEKKNLTAQAAGASQRQIGGSKLVNAEMLNLLRLIKEHLWHGDINDIAQQLGVHRNAVSDTLSGKRRRNSRIMEALYQRAIENKNRKGVGLYVAPKLYYERLLGSPATEFTGKRGGQYNNCNAVKKRDNN